MKEPTPQEKFDTYVGFVRQGQLDYERKVRELSQEHGFPLQALEEALPVGRKVKFDTYVGFVRQGMKAYENDARELASKYGFQLTELEAALKGR